jgi:hypothetical protein
LEKPDRIKLMKEKIGGEEIRAVEGGKKISVWAFSIKAVEW